MKSKTFCQQYDILFSKDAWYKGNKIEVPDDMEQDDLFAAITQEYNKRKQGDRGYDSDDINF